MIKSLNRKLSVMLAGAGSSADRTISQQAAFDQEPKQGKKAA